MNLFKKFFLNEPVPGDYDGNVDRWEREGLYGWGWHSDQPNEPVSLSIYEGSTLLGEVVANQFRQDLLDHRIGDGKHGFHYKLPDNLKDGRNHLIRVQYTGSQRELPSSPISVQFSPLSEDSTLNMPWTDSLLFPHLIQKRVLSREEEQQATDYYNQGYLILKNAIPNDLIQSVVSGSTPLFQQGVSDGARSYYRCQDAWKESESVLNLATFPPILKALRFLYDREPVPFQTLTFRQGSQQREHSDIIHFNSMPARYMCGVWAALEDLTVENGPLFYYPGSHRLPELDMYDFHLCAENNIYETYEELMARTMSAQGLKKEILAVKKGDLLIWSSNLVHGGEPIHNAAATRWSQVTHYFFEECIYYNPVFSNPLCGEWWLPEIYNIRTQSVAPQSYNGRPFVKEVIPQNGRFKIRFV